MVDSSRKLLYSYSSDVYIFTDGITGKDSGNSPDYGLHLVDETTTGCLISAEASVHHSVDELSTPAAVREFAAAEVLGDIGRGGTVVDLYQLLVLMLCAMGPALVNEVRLGPLTPQAVRTLRIILDFIEVTFNVCEKGYGTLFLSCFGCGLKNLVRIAA